MGVVSLIIPFEGPLELEHTLGCGQAFRWRAEGEWHIGTVKDVALKVRRVPQGLEYVSSPPVNASFVRSYFRLDDDLDAILDEISRHSRKKGDCHLKEAVRMYRGLRLLRQDPWECLASYVTSAVSNIPKITRCIENMSRKFGTRIELDGWETYSFPIPEALAAAGARGLRDCELGFRARYISELAREVAAASLDVGALRLASYDEARKALMRLMGVGEKVADCACLFSLDKLEAFPVDRWVQRVAGRLFFRNRPIPVRRVRQWGMRKYGRYAGYAQEYLFHYIRHLPTRAIAP
jgi:N-glycosylase/DNA lyase